MENLLPRASNFFLKCVRWKATDMDSMFELTLQTAYWKRKQKNFYTLTTQFSERSYAAPSFLSSRLCRVTYDVKWVKTLEDTEASNNDTKIKFWKRIGCMIKMDNMISP